jgi:chromosomal replication initiation ATPase DnaA
MTTNSNIQPSENVQVTVRCRPPKENEHGVCWEVQNKQKIVSSQDYQRHKKQHEFLFDHAFYGSDNELLYNSSIKNLINQTMEGYNTTVFAYGQTASGKTFTMVIKHQLYYIFSI